MFGLSVLSISVIGLILYLIISRFVSAYWFFYRVHLSDYYGSMDIDSYYVEKFHNNEGQICYLIWPVALVFLLIGTFFIIINNPSRLYKIAGKKY